MGEPRRWLHSAPFDLGLILGPPVLSALAVLCLPSLRSLDTPVWGWVGFVVCIDVAHVYASLYRTYLDPVEFRRRSSLYLSVPLACWLAGVLLYRWSALAFWRTLAYVAVFHFVRQQYGFLRIYQRLQGGRSKLDDLLDQAAIYGVMLYPLAYWHADPGRRFSWFVEGDFVRLPAQVGSSAAYIYAAVLGAFTARQLFLALKGRFNLAKAGLVYSTAVSWYVGIVYLNSDFAFTITNVVAHGVPYLALVWLYGNRKWSSGRSWLGAIHRPALLASFLGVLVALAYLEEGAWDLLVWKEHASVFGGLAWGGSLTAPALALLVPLLALPQSTHYVLDAWIWRLDGSNPDLKEHLFG
jgi:hypothetical protein